METREVHERVLGREAHDLPPLKELERVEKPNVRVTEEDVSEVGEIPKYGDCVQDV